MRKILAALIFASAPHSVWAIGFCDTMGIGRLDVAELSRCIDELKSSISTDRMMSDALLRHITILETALCRMSGQMKNADAAAEAAIFCPEIPKSKQIPLPRARPPDLILAPP